MVVIAQKRKVSTWSGGLGIVKIIPERFDLVAHLPSHGRKK